MTSYRLKRISFNGREVPIVLQNENGPCPLLAIANILLLRGNISLSASASDVSLDRLMQTVAAFLLDNTRVEDGSPLAANIQKNLDDVISALPKLATGVDVNPRFDSIRGFEFTNEVAIFDLFNISLVHGWLVDPATGNGDIAELTYNQLVSKLAAIMGDETPAHLLTPQSSFASRKASSTGVTTQPSLPQQADVDLITFDDAEQAPPHQDKAENEKQEENSKLKLESLGIPDNGAGLESLETAQQGGIGSDGGAGSSGLAPNSSDLSSNMRVSEEKTAVDNGAHLNINSDSKTNAETEEKKSKEKEFCLRVQDWLEDTSSQLTHHGLISLHEGMKEEQLAIFFRNNHFNAVLKRGEGLYLLVTDQGYMSEPGVVWEKLDAVDGDTQLVTQDFVPYTKNDYVDAGNDYVEVSNHDVELQKALAASLETSRGEGQGLSLDDRRGSAGVAAGLPDDFLIYQPPGPPRPMGGTDADLALAMQLHEEELELERQTSAREASRRGQELHQLQMLHGRPQRPTTWTNPAHESTPRGHSAVSSRVQPHRRTVSVPTAQEAAEPTFAQKFMQSCKKWFTPKRGD